MIEMNLTLIQRETGILYYTHFANMLVNSFGHAQANNMQMCSEKHYTHTHRSHLDKNVNAFAHYW